MSSRCFRRNLASFMAPSNPSTVLVPVRSFAAYFSCLFEHDQETVISEDAKVKEGFQVAAGRKYGI